MMVQFGSVQHCSIEIQLVTHRMGLATSSSDNADSMTRHTLIILVNEQTDTSLA